MKDMKYDDFCSEVRKHFAALQKFLNELKCPDDADNVAFERSKELAIEACMNLEHDMHDEFGEHYDD